MKKQIKIGTILYDDTKLLYKVIDVFPNSCVVENIHDMSGNYSCEIISFRAIESEGWVVVK